MDGICDGCNTETELIRMMSSLLVVEPLLVCKECIWNNKIVQKNFRMFGYKFESPIMEISEFFDHDGIFEEVDIETQDYFLTDDLLALRSEGYYVSDIRGTSDGYLIVSFRQMIK
ncbi:MAG: hypothetical protein OXC46_08390 [Thaumarchaeota archaeon]|nr:hypothetical protein [Nitrososphaerota archaeon]